MCMCESVDIACTCSCIHVVGVCTCTNKNVYHTAESFYSTKISPSLATCTCTFALVLQKIFIEANAVKVATGQKIYGIKTSPMRAGGENVKFSPGESFQLYNVCVYVMNGCVYCIPLSLFVKGTHRKRRSH